MQARLKTTIGWFAERNSHDTVHWPMAPFYLNGGHIMWEPRDRGNDVGEDLSRILNSALVLAAGRMRHPSRSPLSASTFGMQDALTEVYAGLVDDGKFSGRPSSGVAVDIVSLPLRISSLVPDANSSQI
jgi:hypothetical protein